MNAIAENGFGFRRFTDTLLFVSETASPQSFSLNNPALILGHVDVSVPSAVISFDNQETVDHQAVQVVLVNEAGERFLVCVLACVLDNKNNLELQWHNAPSVSAFLDGRTFTIELLKEDATPLDHLIKTDISLKISQRNDD